MHNVIFSLCTGNGNDEHKCDFKVHKYKSYNNYYAFFLITQNYKTLRII